MTDNAPDFQLRFDTLIAEGRAEVEAGNLEGALRAFDEAGHLAESFGEGRGGDRAWLNRCAVLIAMQRAQDLSGPVLQRMRTILMAGDDPVNCRLAAYNIARIYELTEEYRKGLFYARIALERSRTLGSEEWLASSYNQLGLLTLATSQFEEAREAFETALALLPDEEVSVRRAAIEDNLGYVHVVLGHHDRGFRLLYSSIRALRRLRNRRERVFPHLRLCLAHIETGRVRHALRHGVRALALAEEFAEPVSTQYALYLLGEAAQLAGDRAGALEYFRKLQERYFPGDADLPEVLLAVDVRKLINLTA